VHHQLARIRYEKNVEVPNITKIQSRYRFHKCRQCLHMRRKRLIGIGMMQMIFRRRISARAIKATKIRCAIQIQNFYRAFSRRNVYSVQRLAHRSTRIYASLLISSFWMKYRDGIRVQVAKECSLIQQQSALLKQLQKQEKNVQKELSENFRYERSQEILLKRFRIRRHVVKQDIKEASQRLAEVEGSLEEMQLCIDYKYKDTQAASTQWIELFTNEILAIRNQIEMGFEELYCCSVYISHCCVSRFQLLFEGLNYAISQETVSMKYRSNRYLSSFFLQQNLRRIADLRERLEFKQKDISTQKNNVRAWIHQMFLRLSSRKSSYEYNRNIRNQVEKWSVKVFDENKINLKDV